jgi:hypothetical protein
VIIRFLTVFSFLFVVIVSLVASAQAETEWVAITEPDEVRELVNEKTLDGKYWKYYYRNDGNMAYYYPSTNSMTVRKWYIDDKGKVCSAIYSKPDRVIDCVTIQRASDDPTSYRMKGNFGLTKFEIFDEPPENMSSALSKTAGPVQ